MKKKEPKTRNHLYVIKASSRNGSFAVCDLCGNKDMSSTVCDKRTETANNRK